MDKEDLIKLADKWLKSIPDLKSSIRIIGQELKDNCHDSGKVNKLKRDMANKKARLNTIAMALNNLEDVDQRIVCYKYIDGLSGVVIGRRTGYSGKTIYKKLNIDIPLQVGRLIFGMEQEFWDEFERGIL